MLYPQEETLEIILKIYEYLRLRMKTQPRCMKIDKPLHQGWVNIFMKLLPDNAGVDYIWDFMTYQFYIYAHQDQKLRPTPAWFIGKEAIRRWLQYDDGAKWYAQEWVSAMKFKNPVSSNSYFPISTDSLLTERYRMSRVAGANFCGIKYGDSPYDSEAKVCYTCPHENICEKLYGRGLSGKSVYDKVDSQPQIIKSRVRVIEPIHRCDYLNEIEDD